MCEIDWQATAAWVQAILTGVAVFAAAKLQERFLSRRDLADRNRRLEAAAAIARWVNALYRGLVGRADCDGMDPQGFAGLFRTAEFVQAQRAMDSFPVVELGDVQLTEAFLSLSVELSHAGQELEAARAKALQSTHAVPAQTLMKKHEDDIFKKAADVEQRVAKLVGRKPLL